MTWYGCCVAGQSTPVINFWACSVFLDFLFYYITQMAEIFWDCLSRISCMKPKKLGCCMSCMCVQCASPYHSRQHMNKSSGFWMPKGDIKFLSTVTTVKPAIWNLVQLVQYVQIVHYLAICKSKKICCFFPGQKPNFLKDCLPSREDI